MKGGRLKQAREAINLKQEDMADKLNIGQSAYSKMERGKSDFSAELLALIPELGINLNWIITGKGEMFLPEPDETSNLLNEMSNQVRVMRDDMDKIENTIKKLMGRK
jgi:transcriptional regulator with XRE-family HTH domain